MSNSRPVVVAGLLLGVCAASPQAPPTTLQSNASLVLVDVVVTNKGKPVQGLNESQFKVMEDGKERTITSFEEHRPAHRMSPGDCRRTLTLTVLITRTRRR
jgi:hypothetical protein